jgi:hypothetical protein
VIDLIHKDFDIAMALENGADGLRNLRWGKNGEGNLIQEGLEGVVIFAVNHGYVHGQLAESQGCVDAGESAADYGDARTARGLRGELCRQLTHGVFSILLG